MKRKKMNTLTKQEEDILLHTLGWSNLRYYEKHKLEEKPSRNYFYTDENSDDYKRIKHLVDLNLMVKSSKTWDNKEFYFHVTKEGIDHAYYICRNRIDNNKPNTRSKRRYQAYLHSESDESFIDWLRNKYWDDYRKRYNC